ncbi:MAG TPA: hypothetical protein PKA64_13545 [Myxococcota bacterium]|nr:hypothetical protein [Myxococcota bacterium]
MSAALLLLGAAGWSPAARAQDEAQRAWTHAHAALLEESLEGDLERARDRYTDLLQRELPAGDPSLALVQYHLGEVLWELSDVAAAREVLDACIRGGVEKSRCLDLRSRIDLEADAVHVIPTTWSFANEDHGFLLPHAFRDHGSIRIINSDGQSELVWEAEVDDDASLVLGFRDPTPVPRYVYLRLQASTLDARVELVFEDMDGHRYGPPGPDPRLPQGAWVDLVANISELIPLEPSTPPLDPARLHRMFLHDTTGTTEVRGRNVLRIDTFEVR